MACCVRRRPPPSTSCCTAPPRLAAGPQRLAFPSPSLSPPLPPQHYAFPLLASRGALSGSGTERDHESAIMYYRQAADQGHSKAQAYLGFVYATGHNGMVRRERGRAGGEEGGLRQLICVCVCVCVDGRRYRYAQVSFGPHTATHSYTTHPPP